MKPNSILALAMACAATNTPLMRDLERMQPRPVKPQTQADFDRLAAAQAKRERKNSKRADSYLYSEIAKGTASAYRSGRIHESRIVEMIGKIRINGSINTACHSDRVPMDYASMPVTRMPETKPFTMQDLAKIKDAMIKDEMVLISADESCDFCTNPDGTPCYPNYGLAPHTHTGSHLGETVFLPKSDWPPNFEPDPDCHGMGTWHCPKCGA